MFTEENLESFVRSVIPFRGGMRVVKPPRFNSNHGTIEMTVRWKDAVFHISPGKNGFLVTTDPNSNDAASILLQQLLNCATVLLHS